MWLFFPTELHSSFDSVFFSGVFSAVIYMGFFFFFVIAQYAAASLMQDSVACLDTLKLSVDVCIEKVKMF